jgi:hypothetical protein
MDIRLIRFFVNSNAEKKMAFTTQERLMETPRPRKHVRMTRQKYSGVKPHTAVHPSTEELHLGPRSLLSPTDEAISLVNALCSINGKDLCLSQHVHGKHRMSVSNIHMPN